jgi:hypothetical protein
LKANIASAAPADIVNLLKSSNTDVAPELVLQPGLDGARILSFPTVGAMLSSIDAEPDQCVSYLRLYAFVQHVGAHREFPRKTAVSQAATDPHVSSQLEKHGVTEEMLLHMDPTFMFSSFLGVKASMLTAIKEAVEVDGRFGMLLKTSSQYFQVSRMISRIDP